MANTTKKKTKYPEDREKVSEAFKGSKVVTFSYTTNPRFEINIHEDLKTDVKSDILNAIDETLKHHGL